MPPLIGPRRAWSGMHPLVRELGVVLVVKLVLLAGIWYAFVRDAPAPQPASLFAPVTAHHQETPR
jgi:hypothetical protein